MRKQPEHFRWIGFAGNLIAQRIPLLSPTKKMQSILSVYDIPSNIKIFNPVELFCLQHAIAFVHFQ
ncbi:hypothetical protein EG028_02260 [Chitinophaga barathri]|uniref:Uncharacterized protein n=1 Tax=Chitinophaga barathri TaxID=1647451 RepID=A0A3N4MSM1_9BACT|nr:hypothetical protein EG028_02260 [Chitinophaga barathri]